MVRGKFKVTEIVRRAWDGGVSAFLKLEAVYDQSLPEDQSYAKATPSGTITMQVDNPHAVEALQLGKSFYVDFTEVPE